MEEAAKIHPEQDEWLRKFYQNFETNQENHDKIIQGLETKEIEYLSANSGYSNNEKQETDKSGMKEALAALEITPKIKQVPQEENQSVSYHVEPYEPSILFTRRLEHHTEEALVHETMESLKKIKINRRKIVYCRYSRLDGASLLPSFLRRDNDSLFCRRKKIFSRRLCGHDTTHALVKKKGKEKDKFYGKLILELGNEVCSSVATAMERLVEKLGNTEDKIECKKLKKELEEAWLSNTFLRIQNE
ncbi:hypothetical protein Tco_0317203 [Tanacetum coccineum]